MGAVKDQISVPVVERLAAELSAAGPRFPTGRFVHRLQPELAARELMARVDLVADCLVECMPEDFPVAAAVVHRALEFPGFAGWMTLPVGEYVARAGIGRPRTALPLLAALTSRFSCEFAIRPFIVEQNALTYAHLREWVTHPDEHVRRLVSEGTRPRLPWARRLQHLVADPSPNIELLDRLVDDPSPYVRRSVANHLNDISRDHPALARDIATAWCGRGDLAAKTVRHGLRTLVKQGDPAALALVGADARAWVSLTSLTVDAEDISIGDTVGLSMTVRNDDPAPATVVVDYRVHFLGAAGNLRPKVFKLTRRTIDPGAEARIDRRHRFAHVSTRQIREGLHEIDVLVNGRVSGRVRVAIRTDRDVVEMIPNQERISRSD